MKKKNYLVYNEWECYLLQRSHLIILYQQINE